MTETFDAVAREVQRAVEQMPYRDFTELTADGSAERPTTLREFFENTWQGEHADEVFSAAANVATRAAITAHTKALSERARQAAATIAALKAEIERLTRALRSIAWPMNEAGPWAQAVAASALPDTLADSDGDDGDDGNDGDDGA